jgi:hypothetical protein
MSDDQTRPPDVKAIWKGQRLEIPPVAVETVRRNARRLQRRRLWTVIQGTMASILLVVVAVPYIRVRALQGPPELSDALQEAGMGLLILYAIFYGWRVLVLFRPRRVPNDAAACLDFHRLELERHRDTVRGLWRWALIPVLPSMGLLLIGRWIGPPAINRSQWLDHLTILGAAVFMLETCIMHWLWNEHRADRWQDRIDELDAIGKEEAR